jgi:hypothetical protein
MIIGITVYTDLVSIHIKNNEIHKVFWSYVNRTKLKPKLHLFPIPNEQLPNIIDDYFDNMVEELSE